MWGYRENTSERSNRWVEFVPQRKASLIPNPSRVSINRISVTPLRSVAGMCVHWSRLITSRDGLVFVGTPEPRLIPAERTLTPIEEGFDEPQRQPSTSQRALASSSRPAASRPNGLSY